MLEFLLVRHPRQVRNLLNSYDPLKDTWMVSDLKSKQEIQNESVSRYGYFSDDAILRVSDFWKLWIRRLAPTTQVVSSDFVKVLIQNFVEEHGTKLGIAESEVLTLTKAVQEFAPILLHPSGDELIQEWLEAEYSTSKKEKKWTRWYQLSKVVLNQLLQKNIIDARWSASYMQSLDLNLFRWSRKLYVDLGSELSSVEMGLFKILSQMQDVVIIVPEPEWAGRFPYLLNVYKENLGSGKVTETMASDFKPTLKQDQFIRLSTQLAEIKYAVAKCREWADKKVPLDDIAIIAADIERYWPVLQHYLDEEGLPYKKDTVAALNGLGDVQNLLAILKNYSPDVAWDSLEKTSFPKSQKQDFQFEKFKGLFFQLYDQDDLGRDQKIKELYYRKVDYIAPITRDEFLKFLAEEVWKRMPDSSSKQDLFEIIFKDFIGQSMPLPGSDEKKSDAKFKRSLWVSFLKNRLTHKEFILQKNSGSGLNILSLMSAHMTNAEHKIYLGLNEENFVKRQTTLIGLQDSNALKNIFDLSVESSEESYLDFNLRWQSLAATPQTFFTSAHMSFNSDPLNGSLFFIENSPQSQIITPAQTRVDELQGYYSHAEAAKDTGISYLRLSQDKSGFEAVLPTNSFNSLSAGDFENYARCSFKLLASKGFRLRSDSQAALDLDHRDKGSLAHSLFEFLLKNIESEFDESSVSAFLDKERETRRLFINLDRIWVIQRSKFLLLAKKFYKAEKERAKIFSFEVERQVQFYFDMKDGKFTLTPGEDRNYAFNLRIDRVDTHREKKYAIIYDYKSSENPDHKPGHWLTDYQFQMLLYMAAMKLVLPEQLSLKGSLYYYYKNFKINTGMIDLNVGLNDFLFNKRNSSLYDENEREEAEKKFIQLTSEILGRLSQGEFTTKPYEPVICNDCDWRKLCRAAHLN